MSYTPTNWQAGDTVTSAKLNKMEQGITAANTLPEVSSTDNGKVLTVVEGQWAKAAASGGGVLVVNAVQDNDTIRLDKTWQEITDAGFAVLWRGFNHELTVYQLYSTYYEENVEYEVVFATFFLENTVTFQSSTADGYPILST